MCPTISSSPTVISGIPSVRCQNPFSAKSRRKADSDWMPSGKKAPRLVTLVWAS